MLDSLIFFTAALLVALIAIKYGVLEILAIILAIIALIPFGMAVYLYFAKSPEILYEVVKKPPQGQNGETIYDIWLGFRCQRGQVQVKQIFVAPEWGMSAVADALGSKNQSINLVLEESGFGPSIRIDSGNAPLYEKTGYAYAVRFTNKEPKDAFKLKIFLDAVVDPFKQGVISVFRPDYNYRLAAEVLVDLTKPDTQAGTLTRRW
jgi:hypothetical protein